jgi:tetratricopeptide (TPR) repeat protein
VQFEPGSFIDRREAILLFQQLRGRNPTQPWPLLPFLTFIAIGGSGKSTLLEYLRSHECSHPTGQALLPHVFLDFNQPTTPKELLQIWVAIRNQLQMQADPWGKYLRFPRFDLGASIALAAPPSENPQLITRRELSRKISEAADAFKALDQIGSTFTGVVPLIQPIITGIKATARIPKLNVLLQQLEKGPGWQWYREHTEDAALRIAQDIREVMLRLHLQSMPDHPRRQYLVEEVLSQALLTDLFEALQGSEVPLAWDHQTNVIFFLDGFEGLQDQFRERALHLLQLLTLTEHRKQGKTDPLLLVIGSRNRVLVRTEAEQDAPFEEQTNDAGQTTLQDEQVLQQRIKDRLDAWQQRLPRNRRVLRLQDLYLPFPLHDFGPTDTNAYLAHLGMKRQTAIFTDQALRETIQRITHGHPLYLALAAVAVLEAEARNQILALEQLEQALVPSELAGDHQDEQIATYLLNLFLRQLPPDERRDLIFCAAPRVLDAGAIRAVLELPTDDLARHRWERYRSLTFTRTINAEQLVFHPIVREMLLGQLRPGYRPEGDFERAHNRLLAYFTSRANSLQGSGAALYKEEVQIEGAYHALALGDATAAMTLALAAQQGRFTRWTALLESVRQAPTILMPEGIKQQAKVALDQAEEQRTLQDAIAALVLHHWLLSTVQQGSFQSAALQGNIGNAYTYLSGRNRQTNLEAAIVCYQAALQVFTKEDSPEWWAAAQNNLGDVFAELPQGDQQANLQRALEYYQAALEIYTPENFPVEWAGIQTNIGVAYAKLPTGDKQANLEQALGHYQAALQIFTCEQYPYEWARTQLNMGNAYKDLLSGNRQENLLLALTCYQHALLIRTREQSQYDWASTQHNLGLTWKDLAVGNRHAFLQSAIACHVAALEVFTLEEYPEMWAACQEALGLSYRHVPTGNRQADLEKAIAYFEDALQVYMPQDFPVRWAEVQINLGTAYSELPEGDRRVNLEQASQHYQEAMRVCTLLRMDHYTQRAKACLDLTEEEIFHLEQQDQGSTKRG